MKTEYKGYEIVITKYKGIGEKVSTIYYTIIRISDKYFCRDSYVDDKIKTVGHVTKQAKKIIRQELLKNDPWNERREKSVWD